MTKAIDIQTIKSKLKQEQQLKLIATFCMLVAGIALIYHFFGDNIILVTLGLVVLLGGMKFAWQQWQFRQVDRHPLLQLLQTRSRKIVWVYSIITQRMPFGLQFSRNVYLYFKLVDGEEWVITIPEVQIEVVMKALNQRLPHATFGYSKDKEQWYMANPEMMYKD